jgi:hypothetical protein
MPFNQHFPFIFHAYSHDTVDGCEILHQLIDGKHPIIGFQHVSTIQGGAGFFPSTVLFSV